jgi:PilZ domain
MSLQAAVGLTGQDRHKAHFTVPARATHLNRHGAAIHVTRELPVGTTLTLKNQQGTQVTARVVSHLKEVEGLRTYGVEFVEHDEKSTGFWGISFPTN